MRIRCLVLRPFNNQRAIKPLLSPVRFINGVLITATGIPAINNIIATLDIHWGRRSFSTIAVSISTQILLPGIDMHREPVLPIALKIVVLVLLLGGCSVFDAQRG